jgi:hypothetical protein
VRSSQHRHRSVGDQPVRYLDYYDEQVKPDDSAELEHGPVVRSGFFANAICDAALERSEHRFREEIAQGPRDRLARTAKNGVVTLSGKIEVRSDQDRMMLVTMSIEGVRSVVSHLVLERPT